MKQRLSLICSRAAREIAHGTCSFPSVISKSIRLPSQRGRDGDVDQLKSVMAVTPFTYALCSHYDFRRINYKWQIIRSNTSARQEFIELSRLCSEGRFARRTALRDETEQSPLDPSIVLAGALLPAMLIRGFEIRQRQAVLDQVSTWEAVSKCLHFASRYVGLGSCQFARRRPTAIRFRAAAGQHSGHGPSF